MNQQQYTKWAGTRTSGRSRYIITRGVLGFGLTVAILTTLLELGYNDELDYRWVVVRFIVFPVIGMMLALFRWQSQQSQSENRPKKP